MMSSKNCKDNFEKGFTNHYPKITSGGTYNIFL